MTVRASSLPNNLGNLIAPRRTADRPVFVDLRVEAAPVTLTAQEFDASVRGFARGLGKLGTAPGDRVGFLSANRWEMLASYLGTMLMGAVAVPINYKLPVATISHIVRDAGIRRLFVDGERRPLVPEGIPLVDFDDPESPGLSALLDPGPLDAFEPGERDLAEILYTSGSTGMPKGVPLTHRGQMWALSKYVETGVRNNRLETSLIVAPLYHMNAIVNSCACLLNGIAIISQPRFDAKRYIDAVAHYRCTRLSGVPTMLAMVAALDSDELPADLAFVERISIGSAPLSDALCGQVRRIFPNAAISNGYGTTEAGPSVFGPHPEGKASPPLSIGYPYDDVSWRLSGGTDPNEGALELKTPALTHGYLNRPEADSERFVDGWYRTNDIMRRDEDGFFYFVSRADDMFVCGGENIYPGEVERLLNRHPAVQDSLVVSAPDDLKGSVPVAFVVPLRGAEVSDDDIRQFAIANGPAYAHPRQVVFKHSLPIGGTHKVDRQALEREAATLMIACGRSKAVGSPSNRTTE